MLVLLITTRKYQDMEVYSGTIFITSISKTGQFAITVLMFVAESGNGRTDTHNGIQQGSEGTIF
jgi:hypothetical protein